MREGATNTRLSRCGSSRSPGPDRRDGRLRWDLWNLRTLKPDADLADLEELRVGIRQTLAREREALARLWSGDRGLLAPGHTFFDEHPELAGGVILTLHLGPYQLVPEPLVAAGLEPVVLLNRRAMSELVPRSAELGRRLGHSGRIQWVVVEEAGCVRTLRRALVDERPVLVYLDGNVGSDGYGGTRRRGLVYHLPGRDVKVRTGLARLVCRLGCPVHPVVVRWDGLGTPVWRKEPTQVWSRDDDPELVTRLFYDWVFHEIAQSPEQWRFWDVLKESAVCFSTSRLGEPIVPAGLRDDFRRAFWTCLEKAPDKVKLILEKSVEVWPGDVLADLTEDRFFAAAGLRDEELHPLRDGRPTLSDLVRRYGLAWVRFHGLRLCLLGLARLGG